MNSRTPVKERNVSDFDRGRIVAYRDCGLFYRCIAVRVGQDPVFVCKMKNRWVIDGHRELHVISRQPVISNSREDRHVTCMSLMDSPSREP
ncbi:HTH_Tnp_Tc3_2 domain-containing protein [Trichonephila clavipes]|nr:HTH_Tnp_Tc3_2 domain-containing protein [Trichonephila clavipes]